MDELATAEEMRKMELDALRDDLFEEEPDKRGVVSLARSGYLKPTTRDFADDDEESSFYPAQPDEDKRGGISSIARNGYYQKRPVDAELEQLMSEVYGIGEKRSVASLARSYSLPNSVKNSFDNDDEKRNLPSLLRDRTSPLGEGKRHIGSFVANHGIPFVNNNKDDGKRNVGSLARNRDFPYAVKFGKRETSEEEGEEMSKRYVATLLRQGRLPVGVDSPDHSDVVAVKESHDSSDKDELSQDEGGKMNVRMKKSVPTTVQGPSRIKRDVSMDEFGGPRDDMVQFVDDAADSPINKRYFGVRGGGKMPGGRLPKVGGRSRSRHGENSGRRRH
ncbi:hypothetical protein O3M35_009400 [Rhynocoris fuscipes]|uniref:Uncharacterized protein n=1 Tax=Rhynocoris fuscipes TaxID=488301 RepID=A0AAW1D3M7_9HEMI